MKKVGSKRRMTQDIKLKRLFFKKILNIVTYTILIHSIAITSNSQTCLDFENDSLQCFDNQIEYPLDSIFYGVNNVNLINRSLESPSCITDNSWSGKGFEFNGDFDLDVSNLGYSNKTVNFEINQLSGYEVDGEHVNIVGFDTIYILNNGVVFETSFDTNSAPFYISVSGVFDTISVLGGIYLMIIMKLTPFGPVMPTLMA